MDGERLLKIAGKFSRFGKKVSSKMKSGVTSAADDFDPLDITKTEGMVTAGLLLSPAATTGKKKKKSQGKHILKTAGYWNRLIGKDLGRLKRAAGPGGPH